MLEPLPPQSTPTSPQLHSNEGGNDNRRSTVIWKGLTEVETATWVDNTYREIVGWSTNNLFEPPKCAATTNVVKEMTAVVNNYNRDNPLAPFALETLFLLPKLFFQKTHSNMKSNENVKALTRRVDLWLNNKLDELMDEARAIQKRLPRPTV